MAMGFNRVRAVILYEDGNVRVLQRTSKHSFRGYLPDAWPSIPLETGPQHTLAIGPAKQGALRIFSGLS